MLLIGNSTFTSNKGTYGGALLAWKGAKVQFMPGTTTHLIGNTATADK
jgi:hypothetical protein